MFEMVLTLGIAALTPRVPVVPSPTYAQRHVNVVMAGGRLVSQIPLVSRLPLPADDWRRPSSVRFWRCDLSCGAGSISSPVLAEHQKNASEFAVIGTDAFSWLCSVVPKYLLLSGIGVITRELASREITEAVQSSLESTEAKPRAAALSRSLRSGLDQRVTRVLAGGGFGDRKALLERAVNYEVATLQTEVQSIEDVVNNQVTRALVEVVELEVADRVEKSVSDAVGLTGLDSDDARRELAQLMTAGDKDGNRMLTADEVFELYAGEPLDEQWAALVREWVVLKDIVNNKGEVASTRWERWASLATARWLYLTIPIANRLLRITGWLRAFVEAPTAALREGDLQAAIRLAMQQASTVEELWQIDSLPEPLNSSNVTLLSSVAAPAARGFGRLRGLLRPFRRGQHNSL